MANLSVYLKKIANHSVIYGVSNSVTAAVGYVLLPIYARLLLPEEFGIFSTINITGAVLGIIYDMGLIAALFRWYFDYSQSEEDKRKIIVSTVLIFYFITSSIATVIIFFFSRSLSGLLFKGQYQHSPLVQLMIVTTYINLLLGVPLTILRLKEKAYLYMKVSILRGIGILAITLLYLAVLKGGLLGIYKGGLLVSFIIAAVLFGVTYNDYIFKFSAPEIKKMLIFGLMYLPTIIFMWIINFSDRYFLNYYSTLEDVGIYSFGYKIGQIIFLMVTAFSTAWTPILFSIIKEDNAKAILSTIMTYFFLTLFSIALLMTIFSEDIVKLVSVGKYIESYKVVSLISFSYFLYGIYVFLFNGLMITKRIGSQPIIIGLSALLNILLNIYLIPRFGYIGAAYSTLFTYAAVVFGTYVMSQRCYYINYEKVRLFKITAAGALIYFISNYDLFGDMAVIKIFWKPFLFMMFFYMLYIWKFFNLKELNKVKSLFLGKCEEPYYVRH
ncbi:MAG: oligosaccharide flippase family protein [Candidatus Omnitrophota bacterium]